MGRIWWGTVRLSRVRIFTFPFALLVAANDASARPTPAGGLPQVASNHPAIVVLYPTSHLTTQTTTASHRELAAKHSTPDAL